MKRWEESTTIKAPATTVYAFVSDFLRHGEWSGHGLTATKDGDGPTAVGSTFSTTAKQFGTQREHSTVTDMAPGTTFAWDSVGGLGRVHHWFSLTEEGGATRVKKGAEFLKPSFLAKVTSFRISKELPENLRKDLERIKTKLES
jgi:uncharacterized membrane protein